MTGGWAPWCATAAGPASSCWGTPPAPASPTAAGAPGPPASVSTGGYRAGLQRGCSTSRAPRMGSAPAPVPAGICLRGRIEISERDIGGRCSSSCGSHTHLGAALSRGCVKISACVTKLSAWARWFQRCDICECDCHVPCGEPCPAGALPRGSRLGGEVGTAQNPLSLLSSGSSR